MRKAFEIDRNKLEEGYLMSIMSCYAENRNEAKAILLKEYRYEGLVLKIDGNEVDYLTIPVVRCKELDQIEYEGEWFTKVQIELKKEKVRRNKELQDILDNPSIAYCYIKKHGQYYAPNHCGYTSYKERAGVYTKEDAVSCARSCDELIIDRIDIEEHNKYLTSIINDIQSRLITGEHERIPNNH